nr:hypothetical protein CFP56_09650 [Quercus suber]
MGNICTNSQSMVQPNQQSLGLGVYVDYSDAKILIWEDWGCTADESRAVGAVSMFFLWHEDTQNASILSLRKITSPKRNGLSGWTRGGSTSAQGH